MTTKISIKLMSIILTDREVRSLVDRTLQQREELNTERSALEDAIVEFIYAMQDKMAAGFPKFGIPPLDPLYIARTINYNLTSDLLEYVRSVAGIHERAKHFCKPKRLKDTHVLNLKKCFNSFSEFRLPITIT
jgi:hypothetical protein